MALRKYPNADLKKDYALFTQVGLVLSLLILIAATNARWERGDVEVISLEQQEQIQMEEIIQTEQVQRPPPPPTPPVPIEVPDDTEIEEIELSLDADLDIDRPVNLPPPPPPPAPTQPQREEEPDIFVVVEAMPEMIPNEQEAMAALQRSIRYPEIARRAGVEGRVIVQFVVDEQGRVTDPVVVRGIGAGLDEEAIRAVQTLRFRPGRQRGRPVKVQMSLPITFRLTNR